MSLFEFGFLLYFLMKISGHTYQGMIYLKEIQRISMINLIEADNRKINIYEEMLNKEKEKPWWRWLF